MSRVDEVKKIISAHSSVRGYRMNNVNNEYTALLRIEEVLDNIAVNLAELNDRLEKREDGHIANE